MKTNISIASFAFALLLAVGCQETPKTAGESRGEGGMVVVSVACGKNLEGWQSGDGELYDVSVTFGSPAGSKCKPSVKAPEKEPVAGTAGTSTTQAFNGVKSLQFFCGQGDGEGCYFRINSAIKKGRTKLASHVTSEERKCGAPSKPINATNGADVTILFEKGGCESGQVHVKDKAGQGANYTISKGKAVTFQAKDDNNVTLGCGTTSSDDMCKFWVLVDNLKKP